MQAADNNRRRIVKAIRYKFIYDNLSVLQIEYSNGSLSPMFGKTNERDNAFLPTARFDVEKTIRTIVVRYWKDGHPSGDSDIIYKITDRIAAIEFYDLDGDVVAEVKADRSNQYD